MKTETQKTANKQKTAATPAKKIINTILKKQILRITLLCLMCCNANFAFADSLDDILTSLGSKDLGKAQPPGEIQGDTWIERGTNLEKLFSHDSKNIVLLKEWIGDLSDKQFKFVRDEKKKKKEYVALFADYTAPGGYILNVSILVPHPKFIDLISSGLLEDFHKQVPPGLKVVANEKMNIKNHEATYYQHKEKGCSLLFQLPKHATLNISDKQCVDSRFIVQLAELFNLDRLVQKLNT